MTTVGKKRVSAAEAAEILGVPRYAISRIDRTGEIIQRYKLGHKTHVYDLDSLHAYLAAMLVKPISRPSVENTRSRRSRVGVGLPDRPKESLRAFLKRTLAESQAREKNREK